MIPLGTPFRARGDDWRAVAHHKAANHHTALGELADELRSTYPSSGWASKAIPLLHTAQGESPSEPESSVTRRLSLELRLFLNPSLSLAFIGSASVHAVGVRRYFRLRGAFDNESRRKPLARRMGYGAGWGVWW